MQVTTLIQRLEAATGPSRELDAEITVSDPAYEAIARFLFSLLDDIDTADDLAKGNEQLYRNLVRRHHARRFEVASTDGYTVTFGGDKSRRTTPTKTSSPLSRKQ